MIEKCLSILLHLYIILTSDEIYHIALSINARESVLLANFTARQYILRAA